MGLEHKDRSKFIEEKIWGYKHRLYIDSYAIVDRLFIKKGGYSSLHYHKEKYNRFYVESGSLLIYIQGSGEFLVGREEIYKVFDVDCGKIHQFRALTDVVCFEFCYNRNFSSVNDCDITRLTEGGLNEA